MQVGFLFSHRVDQVWHAAPIAFELSRLYPAIKVSIVCANCALADTVNALSAEFPGHDCNIQLARIPLWARFLDPLLSPWSSLEKYAAIRGNNDLFKQMDAVAIPELTSIKLKLEAGLDHLKMIYTHHGAGDREKGFEPRVGQCDFVLVPGRKVERRLLEGNLIRPGSYRVVGYPKFDVISRRSPPNPLFDNDRPVILYNPHFKPELSSWQKMGLNVLEYFRNSSRYNLIFAPHIRLFDHWFRYGARLPRRYRQCHNIHADLGSRASADMSYTLAADLYLGDVSSQVYEFLWRPRPCIFLNAYGADWKSDPNYAHWHFGPVLTDVADLDDALSQGWRLHEQYLPRQRKAFMDTFDLQRTTSATRAAHAIADFLGWRSSPPVEMAEQSVAP